MSSFNHNNGSWVEIEGAKIYYEEIGDKDKPVLLLLHGGLGNLENCNYLVPLFQEKYRLIAVDSRGHGASTLGDKPLTYAQITADIESLLQVHSITKLSIVGFSDGGIVGYRLAAGKKIAVDKLVTIGASWQVSDVVAAQEVLQGITPESAKEIFSEDYKRYDEINPNADYDQLVHSTVEMWLDTSMTGHPEDMVDAIESEMLLIRGDRDFLHSLDSLLALQKRIKGAALSNIPFASHAVYLEQPDVLALQLKAFLL